ncbi:MAG: B-box zinc finger protein [Deltaproteobacteria bacterium]|nr:B-box zinc finger protein [Deltaproteobacteria bacterium]
MKCKNHPNREAVTFCANCGIPLCSDCAEKSPSGKTYCFQCAMIYSVSEVGTSIVDKREKSEGKKKHKKKKWGAFQYFVIVSCVLILVMGGVIIFGAPEESGKKIDFANNQRVFLFMVDSCIKRYAHYEGEKYPEKLTDMVPKYLPMKKEDLHHLESLLYQKDPSVGYRLSMAKPKPGEMNIIISPKGIQYSTPTQGGA